MEIIVAGFIGVWLTVSGILAYIQLKKDLKK